MVDIATATQRPLRMSIADLETGDALEMQYNPTEPEEELGTNFGRQPILGMSHEQLQFSNTKNLVVTMALNFDALTQVGDDRYDIEGARNFLHSLHYPSRGATDVRSGAPPRTLLVWPDLYALRVHIISLRIKFTRFAATGGPTAFTANVTWENVRDSRLYSDDVRQKGTRRD